jgi:simple sugar transport system ATP-binding protein
MTVRNALEVVNISKRFGGMVALDAVSLKLEAGSFHALLGENGAGKSTLVKCIMGYYHPDEGAVMVEGREQEIDTTHDAHNLGIGMVYQHFTLIPNMSVAENLVLARTHLPAILDWRKERLVLEEKMARMPFQVALDTNVNRLSAGERQKVEIIKQLMLDARILILDEPTSVLTPNEADDVLGQLKAMTRSSGLSVLIITHKFREVMKFADTVTVLRKGRLAGGARVADTNPQILANMMVGDESIGQPLSRSASSQAQRTIVEVSGLSIEDDTGMHAISDIDLTVCAGEIVGIAGVSGNGQRELVDVLTGQRTPCAGQVRIHGESYHARREEMRRHRLRCVPEEPLHNACVAGMSVAENLAFRGYDRPPFSVNGWLINRHSIRVAAESLIERFSIQPPNPDNPIGNLSGGNVQRTVLARELSDDVDVLVVTNPCFGLDFSAAAEIHDRIMEARNRGTAVLLISEDLDEIMELSDRMFVISGGRLVHETTPSQADLTRVGQHMAGH